VISERNSVAEVIVARCVDSQDWRVSGGKERRFIACCPRSKRTKSARETSRFP
jgi:hypothetical protein